MKTCNPVEAIGDLRPVVYVNPKEPMTAAAILATIEDCSTYFWRGVKTPSLRTVQRKLEGVISDLGLSIKEPDGSNISEYRGKPLYSPAICQTAIEDLGFQTKPLSEAPFVPLAYGK
jgi:hypothetical protein